MDALTVEDVPDSGDHLNCFRLVAHSIKGAQRVHLLSCLSAQEKAGWLDDFRAVTTERD